jgi:hypothetical protein
MTTGRINQVTIVVGPGGRPAKGFVPGPRAREGRVVKRKGRRGARSQGPAPRRLARGSGPGDHPCAPTEIPQGPVRRRAGPAARPSRTETWDPKVEDARRPVTPEGGYGPRLAPEWFVEALARGHRSTVHNDAR